MFHGQRRRYALPFLLIALACAGSLVGADEVDKADYLGDLEKEVVREINLARTNPERYATFLEAWEEYYDGKLRKLPGETAVRTKEGRRALREAIRFLRKFEPLHALRPSEGMSRGARDHVNDIGRGGSMGHRGSDGSSTARRVNRYGKWKKRVGENIAYGGDDGRELVMRLIIDDGVRGRGHRKNIFDPAYEVIGVAFGKHKTYGTMCVITFAGGYIE